MIKRFFKTSLLAASSLFLIAAAVTKDETIEPAQLRSLYAGPPSQWPRPQLHDGASFTEFGALPAKPKLEGKEAAIVALGEKLFNEPGLSRSGQIACSSCHAPELGFGDGLKTSFGHDRQRGKRNAQPLYTVGMMHELFWDGRTGSLEEQLTFPIDNPIEMASEKKLVERWINRQDGYRQTFKELYGADKITLELIAKSVADYQRSLRPPTSKWDRMLQRGIAVFNDEELQGLHLFRTKAGCVNCHNSPLFSDQKYHNLGISFYGRKLEDLGRFDATKDPADVGYFRTPSLRGVVKTGPYMHNGIFPHLRGVVSMYAGGGGRDRQTQSTISPQAPPPRPDPLLKPVELTPQERASLVAFLETL